MIIHFLTSNFCTSVRLAKHQGTVQYTLICNTNCARSGRNQLLRLPGQEQTFANVSFCACEYLACGLDRAILKREVSVAHAGAIRPVWPLNLPRDSNPTAGAANQ